MSQLTLCEAAAQRSSAEMLAAAGPSLSGICALAHVLAPILVSIAKWLRPIKVDEQ